MTQLTGTERDALAMEYALGLLEAHSERIEGMMTGDPVLASRVSHWRFQFSGFDDTAPAIMPSQGLWRRIGESLMHAPAPAAAPARQAATSKQIIADLWENLTFWRYSAMGAAVAALLFLAGMAIVSFNFPSQPVLVAVLEQPDGKPGAIVEAFADGRVRLIPVQEIEVPQGRALQVWTLRNREEGPISVGLIDRARTLKLDLGKLPAPGSGQLFEITLEPESGSPTGRPTGPILMKGLTADTL